MAMRRLYALPILLAAIFLAGATVSYAAPEQIRSKNFAITEGKTDSTATYAGGAYEILSTGEAYVSGTADSKIMFYNDQAKYGGALDIENGGIIRYIRNAIFDRNTAKNDGGAIFAANAAVFGGIGIGNLEISNTDFISNAANGEDRGTGYGGAIYTRGKKSRDTSVITITNSNFTSNTAGRGGGAIARMSGDLTIIANGGDSVFTGNRAGGRANDIYMGGNGQSLKLTAYGNNKVDLEGGVDFNRNLTIYINSAPTSNYSAGDGTVVLGQLGSNSKRAGLNLQGGTLSFINGTAGNNIYANRVTIQDDTKLGFDVHIDPYGGSAGDIFNFNSIAGGGNFVLNDDSFAVDGRFSDLSTIQSVTLKLIQSRAGYISRVKMQDENGNPTSVLYKYDTDADGNKTPYLKIRFTSNGTFVFSNPQYIDAATNPLVYAFNSDGNDNINFGRNIGTLGRDSRTNILTLNYRRNITLDSWEDLPDASDNNKLKPRNILIPDYLTINFNNRTVTAADGITGMVINGADKNLTINNTVFTNFNNTLTSEAGRVTLSQTAFRNSETAGENGAAIRNTGATVNINGARRGNRTLFYNSNNNTVTGSRKAINGGAIYNEGNGIMSINYATFGANPTTRRRVTTVYGNYAQNGGAIYNIQSDVTVPTGIEDQTETVSNLNVTNSTFVANEAGNNGGAVYNTKTDTATASASIGGTFRRNTAKNDGGAIYNEGNLSTISSTFGTRGRTVEANTATNGGAVANENGGNFTSQMSNYYSNSATDNGGAIYNTGKSTLTVAGGTFNANRATNGAAIFNDTEATLILDAYTNPVNNRPSLTTFSNNVSSNGKGGAIYNLGTIATPSDDIINTGVGLPVAGNFTSNRATYTQTQEFQDVRVTIDRAGDIHPIYTYNSPLGGAIYNEGAIELNQANFSSNSATANVIINTTNYNSFSEEGWAKITHSAGKGGAIYSKSADNMYLVNSTFNRNSAAEAGGAIFNEDDSSTVYVTNSNFTNNSSSSVKTTVKTLTIQNGQYLNRARRVTTRENIGEGGAIYAKGDVNINNDGKYSANTTHPYVLSGLNTRGNAVNGGTTFRSNSAGTGGAIYTKKNAVVQQATFTSNRTTMTANENDIEVGAGGAIFAKGNVSVNPNNYGDTNPLHYAMFTSNSAVNGGAIYSGGTTLVKNATFTSNRATGRTVNTTVNGVRTRETYGGNGGAIYTTGEIRVVNSNFTRNSAVNGGAVYVPENTSAYFINTDFRNNSASQYGGAIYAGENSTIAIVAYDKDVTLTGNRASGRNNSIYLNDATLNIYARQYTDPRDGLLKTYNVTINGIDGNEGGSSRVNLYSEATTDGNDGNPVNIRITGVSDNIQYIDTVMTGDNARQRFETDIGKSCDDLIQDTEITTGTTSTGDSGSTTPSGAKRNTLSFGDENLVTNSSIQFTGHSDLNIANNKVGTLSLKKLALADDTVTNVAIDADLKNAKADDITAETTEGTGTLNVDKVNLTSNNKNAITLKLGKNVSSVTATTAQTREAVYKLKNTVDPETGLMRMVAYGQKAKACTLAAPVAAQLGGYLTQINSYDQAFANMDMDMLKPRAVREAEHNQNLAPCGRGRSCFDKAITDAGEGYNTKFANRYASSAYDYTDYTDNGMSYNSKGLWTRPYATFERVNLSGGPKVSNIGYGNFFGGDFGYKQLSNGWSRQLSAYIGYNGSNQDFKGQSIDQNGGTIGVTEVWYKNNFFTGLTLNVGANSANASTDLGNENFPMLMAGIASKTGYNFEFKHGRFIIQPSVLLSYSFVHTFSHDNGLGNKVSSSPLHAIQVAPGLKFIWNLKNGWQPYFGVNMRWNIIDKTHFSLRDVSIPDMSIDPYVEYGVGVQRKWGERFTGYGQAMIRNGGRNGVMLSFGFRWAIGK